MMERNLPRLCFLLWISGTWAQTQNMEVVKGKLVTLQASYNEDLTDGTVVWNFMTDSIDTVISYTKGSINEGSDQFRGRVGFVKDMPSSDVSLFINNTRESDSGRFVCQVISPGGSAKPAEILLDVKVPPAVPTCSLSGKPVLKGNVTLTCKSSAGKPVPLYKWRRTSPTSEVFFAPMLNENTGTLKLSNLSGNMSGKYVCVASNSAGSENCSISLDIIDNNKVGVIVGATVGSVLGFIFLLCVCAGFLFVFKRRRDREDDMANDIKEDAQAPKRVSWAKSGIGSDVISKNGTLSSIASSPRHREPSAHLNNHHLQQYPQHPASDTASIITATGSAAGYRPPRHQGASTPTHFSYNHSSTLPHGQPTSSQAANGVQERYGHLPQAQELAQAYSQLQRQFQPAPSPPPLPASTITASNINRMGGVPIMVPAQNQAGSLV
ncbi:PREDICTED: endothelial cell-selective adhesion molecule-like [Cyprinodon variegatus]|uniref:Endothelial cell adhesion molecule a n=1 Tax=Cyprinodon variegatus TaxID=28743 RepID=A0A3Q2E5A6_CYPVA|nr:PREDICTED: endothelial cell-selective adhesion molecule-like [Cyprinodon variegatus]